MNINILSEAIQQVSGRPLTLSIDSTEYPVAPMVFAEDTSSKGTFKVRIMVYVPAEVETIPTVFIENDGEPTSVKIEGGKEILARSIMVEYSYPSTPIPPFQYNLWEVFLEYSLDNLVSVDYILTRLRDIDPKTSRGTVTSVQDPVRMDNVH
jgi:hypothetical protein